jgi:hypothetical protein
MSRITEKGATGGLSLFKQAYSSLPANTPSTTPGTGDFNPDLSTCVGQKFDLSDGREVVLVSTGAVAIGSGLLVQASAQVTAFQGLAITGPAATPATAGTFQILVTNGATVLNVNQFQGGYLVTASGTGLGQTLKISSHQPAANAGTFLVTLEDAILVTLDATTTVSLIANPYGNVIVSPTTGTANPVGVTLYALAAATAGTYSGTTGAQTVAGINQYGLIVSKGPVAVLQDADGTTVGFPVGASDLTAGAVGIATLTTQPQIGIAMQSETSAKYGMVYLQL